MKGVKRGGQLDFGLRTPSPTDLTSKRGLAGGAASCPPLATGKSDVRKPTPATDNIQENETRFLNTRHTFFFSYFASVMQGRDFKKPYSCSSKLKKKNG